MNAQQFQQEGNVALFQGRFENAIHCFRQSIILSSHDVNAMLEDVGPMEANTTREQPVMESIGLQLPEIIMTTSSETISSHNVFDLFDRAFLGLHTASAALTSVICIYNIGLTHHTQALLHTYNSTFHFERAWHFYELAWKALLSCDGGGGDGGQPQDPTLLPVTLAMLNNMGHISCHFADRDATETALRGIIDLLPSLLESGSLCQPDVMFFYSYRCYEHIHPMNLATAAAAA